MRTLFALIIPLSVAVMSGATGTAVAAPQILGVSAAIDPLPMNCEEGRCSVELASFCLQKKRDDPNPGDAYTIFNDDGVRLHLSASDGRSWSVPAGDYVKVTAERSFTAVKVELDQETLSALGAEKAEISVAEGVSLVPVPVAGDPDPISERELAYVTDSLRRKADQWMAGDAPKPVAIRIINRIVNATPQTGRMETATREGLWGDVVGEGRVDPSNTGLQKALEMYGACKFRVGVGRYFNMRSCLEIKQDSLMLDMNTNYWQSIDTGS